MPCVERLTEEDYNEVLYVLNTSFTHKEYHETAPHQADFETALPIMWTREHDYMKRHLAVRENGAIVSIVGVYPLPTVIAGEKVLLGTIGNVASLPEVRGRDHMKTLMQAALEEAERIGMVAARLGGLRSRYNRYGFDHAGVIYIGEITRRNAKEYGKTQMLKFSPFTRENHAALDFAKVCQQRNGIYVERETRIDFYCTLCAWKSRPLICFDHEGHMAGYISVAPDGTSFLEWGTRKGLTVTDLATSYLQANPQLPCVYVQVAPYDLINLQAVFDHCEHWKSEPASMFHVFQWDRLVQPLMKLAMETYGLAEGDLVVNIQNWGTLNMRVEGRRVLAEKTARQSSCSLSILQAINFLFGDLPAVRYMSHDSAEAGWFPLPLSWNGQDRV